MEMKCQAAARVRLRKYYYHLLRMICGIAILMGTLKVVFFLFCDIIGTKDKLCYTDYGMFHDEDHKNK